MMVGGALIYDLFLSNIHNYQKDRFLFITSSFNKKFLNRLFHFFHIFFTLMFLSLNMFFIQVLLAQDENRNNSFSNESR